MRNRNLSVALIALAFTVGSCSDTGGIAPTFKASPSGPSLNAFAIAATLPLIRISEVHYDNSGTDSGEAIEISGPAGTDLTGWSIVLYNGSGGAAYNTRVLSGVIPPTCGTRGVVVLTYPVDGIQNGSPDGIALVNGTVVIEFLSYEGVFTAVGGVAGGQLSKDIGVSESGTTLVGQSLSRNGSDVWSSPAANTFGTCNDSDSPPPPEVKTITVAPAAATVVIGQTQAFSATAFDNAQAPIAGVTFTWVSSNPDIATVDANGVATGITAGSLEIRASTANGIIFGRATLQVTEPLPPSSLPTTRFSELHYDNAGTDVAESIEIEGPAGTELNGWQVVLYNGNGGSTYNTRALTGTIPSSCDSRGVIVLVYPQDGIQNGSPDGIALVNASGEVVEFLSYEGDFTASAGPAAGIKSTDIGVSQLIPPPLGQSLQRKADGSWEGPSGSSFGSCNGGPPPPPPANTISFSGRLMSDPPLPVGFEDQLFATLRDGSGAVIATTFTWSSETPDIASIDQNGVMNARAAGEAKLRATADDGTTATFTLLTQVATPSTTAQYGHNVEFGIPKDGTVGDDFIVTYPQYTASYNPNKGTPNWVSYNIDATHFGPEDRCDCFTFDPDLPPAFTRYTTAHYTGAGAFHGYAIDRGHLARSFDRTSGSLDNAHTFYFTNIIPQAADNNQGPWSDMETYLGDRARLQNREVYVIAGVAGSKGTVKNEGKITIPALVWKVAVIVARDQGLTNIDDLTDLEVIAAIMPNDPGIRNVDWETNYKTTVDAVEALSGYNLLDLLPDQVEIAVESNTKPPTAVTDAYATAEGSAVTMSAASSSDPDGDVLTYQWDLGAGTIKHGVTISHVYVQDGRYDVRLTVTDPRGLTSSTTTTVTVSNVAPVIATFDGATLLPYETYAINGSFSDPGADTWTATVDYGDDSGENPLPLSGKSFSLSHTYTTSGTFTLAVRISDDDGMVTRQQAVTIQTPAQGTENVISAVEQLARSGTLDAGNRIALTSKLDEAVKQLEAKKIASAVNKLESFLNQVDALERSDRLTVPQANLLRTGAQRVIRSVSQ